MNGNNFIYGRMVEDMRKVVFTIDDLAWFKRFYNLTEEQKQDIFNDEESFKVIYTLYGEGKNIDRYTLTDHDGNKVKLNDLNGYQRGVVLNDCMAYFNGGKYHGNETEPCGVVDIWDMEKITEHTCGGSAFMKLKLNGKEFEVSVYFREEEQTYKTSADGTEDREKVIEAFNQLY